MGVGVAAQEAPELGRRQRLERLRQTPALTCLGGPLKKTDAWIDRLPFRIGRTRNVQLTLPTSDIAGHHATITRDGFGRYHLVAVQPEIHPVYRWKGGEFQEANHLVLHDRMLIRLGHRGPRLRFHYLGETGEAGWWGPLDPDLIMGEARDHPHLEPGSVGEQLEGLDRPDIDDPRGPSSQMPRHRWWPLALSLAVIGLVFLLVLTRVLVEQNALELDLARDQLRRGWTLQHGDSRDGLGPAQADTDAERLARDRTELRIAQIMSDVGVEEPRVSPLLVKLVQEEIDREVGRMMRSANLDRFLKRYRQYQPRIETIFEDELKLPAAYAYVAWIESNYQLDAESDKGAVGMWQFMAPTARDYGLITEQGEDHRQDFEPSTRAAGRYFLDLIARYGVNHFQVTLAAYNFGPRRIQAIYEKRRLWKPDQRTFEALLKTRGWRNQAVLPEETQQYVPRFFAANLIGSDLAHYLGR